MSHNSGGTLIGEREDTLKHWLFLRLAMATMVTSAGVALLGLAAEGLLLRPLLYCVGAQYLVVLAGFVAQTKVPVRTARLGEAVLDIVVITMCVHFSGGVGSPFSVLYFFPILLAAYSFGSKGALCTAALAAGSFLVYALSTAGGWMPVVPIRYRGEDLSSSALLRGHFEAALLLVIGYLASELSARITSRERKLQQQSDDLARTELETLSILGSMSSGVLIVDLEGQIVRVNAAAERILGVEDRAVMGATIDAIFEETMPILRDQIRDALDDRTAVDRVELNVERADGSSLPLGLSISQQQGIDGEPIGVIAVFQDLSSVMRMRERIRANDRLAAMGELSASIAHEIRNPLASIRGSVEMLSAELNVSGENERLMSLVLKESARLNRLIEDFLEYARLKPIHRRNCRLQVLLDDLQTLVESRSKSYSLASPKLGHDLVLDIDDELIKQVFLNLALNAYDAMDGSGELEIAVSVDVVSSPPEAIVRFLDQGTGFDEETASKLFEPFFTTKAKGTGLGLPLASRIVSGHGGRIEIANRDGGGAVCSVWLPFVGVWKDGILEHGTGALEESASGRGIAGEAILGHPSSNMP